MGKKGTLRARLELTMQRGGKGKKKIHHKVEGDIESFDKLENICEVCTSAGPP